MTAAAVSLSERRVVALLKTAALVCVHHRPACPHQPGRRAILQAAAMQACPLQQGPITCICAQDLHPPPSSWQRLRWKRPLRPTAAPLPPSPPPRCAAAHPARHPAPARHPPDHGGGRSPDRHRPGWGAHPCRAHRHPAAHRHRGGRHTPSPAGCRGRGRGHPGDHGHLAAGHRACKHCGAQEG